LIDRPQQTEKRTLDEQAGRRATTQELRNHLTTAPSPYLRGAASNASVGVGELLLMLRNRETPAPLLLEIGGNREWTRYYRVQRALALHPRTPPVLGRALVPHLYWNELLELSTAPHVNPVVRRLADRSLVERFEGLGLGERIALARRAGRGVIDRLCRSDETPILRVLLTNPRMIEGDVVKIAGSKMAPPDLLGHLVEHPRWGSRRDVRLTLVRNGRTPVPAALGIVCKLTLPDLRALGRDPRSPEIVRVAAERRLQRWEAERGARTERERKNG
jgi:hypothetical protein